MVMDLPEGPAMVTPTCLGHLSTRTDADLLVQQHSFIIILYEDGFLTFMQVRRTVVDADEVVLGRLL